MGDKKIILFGAGHVGLRALSYFGTRNVYCFADNLHIKRKYNFFCGKRIISFDELKEIHKNYYIVASVREWNYDSIKKQCNDNGIIIDYYMDLIDITDFDSRPDIAQYKDAHRGERCFIVGCGPSLRYEDLEKIYENGDISFSCNTIYLLFDKTNWRPDYYVSAHYQDMKDTGTLELCGTKANFFGVDRSNLFGESTFYVHQNKNVIAYNLLNRSEKIPSFSSDPSKYLIVCGTVMYTMLQFSLYFGFNKVILLGFDATVAYPTERKKLLNKNHFYDSSVDIKSIDSMPLKYAPVETDTMSSDMITAAKLAKEYCDSHEVKILNATRGGRLETFERVDFDTLF